MASMYELNREYAEALDAVTFGETDEERETAWEQLAELSTSIYEKCTQYAYFIRNTVGDIEGLKKEEERLYAKRKALENTVDRLKETINLTMRQLGEEEVETPIGKWKTKLNAPSVTAVDMESIPDDFIITEVTRKPDKKAILAYAKANGIAPDGCTITRKESVGFR